MGMPRNSNRGSSGRNNDWDVTELMRERPIAAAAAAAGAAAAGLLLWSRRAQISNQLSNLSEQIGEWTKNVGSTDDTGGLATSGQSSTSGQTASYGRGMSETGGGNASLGATSGGGGPTARA